MRAIRQHAFGGPPPSLGHPGCLFLVSICHQDDGLAACVVVRRITFDKLAPAR